MVETTAKNFAFRNSDVWIRYSHERYLTIEEIRRRVPRNENWEETKFKIEQTRKLQSLPFHFSSLEKVFWFFEADCLKRKIDAIEKRGARLYQQIHRSVFEVDFLLNAEVEEAVTSAIYEGANTTRAKAKQLIAEKKPPKSVDDLMLVNSYDVMRWIKGHSTDPLSLELILRIHAIVTRGTLKGDDVNYVGKFRDDTVHIGPHEGVDYRKIKSALEEALVLTTRNSRYLSPLVQGILVHYFIAYIHPFFDGNGRTARSLFYLLAHQNDQRFVELLSISAYLEEHGLRYERAFQNVVKHDGDLTYFVDFCLDSLQNALETVGKKVDYLLSVREIQNRFELSHNEVCLIQRMLLNKFRLISIEEYALDIQKSREIARRELKHLRQLGFVREIKRGRKNLYQIQPKKLKPILREALERRRMMEGEWKG